MPINYNDRNIVRASVGSTETDLYTVLSSELIIIRDMHICNNSGQNCYISIWLVPAGDSPSDENIMFHQWRLPSNDFGHWTGYQILRDKGDRIVAQAEINAGITITISGDKINL